MRVSMSIFGRKSCGNLFILVETKEENSLWLEQKLAAN